MTAAGATPVLAMISSMATRAVLAELARHYQRLTGREVALESVGGVDAARRIRGGERFDVVVLARDALEALAREKQVQPGSCIDLARSGVAVAVRAGTPHPLIDSEQALKAAVLAARTIGYSTGPSGAALAKQFQRWGIAEALRDRIVTAPPGVPVGTLVAQGAVELGFQQRAELLHVPGIEVVGGLPAAVDVVTTFSGAVGTSTAQLDEATALLRFLCSPAADQAKRRQGMEPAIPREEATP